MIERQIKEEIELWIEDYFKDKGNYNKIIYDAMKYSLTVGGKRIRPILMLLTYKMYREDYKKIIPLACAVEMIHTYSLIHDDLPCMDNDDLRRGKPTNHKVFGYAMAVLAGDGLLNEAMNIMFKYILDNKEGLEACYTISKSAGVEGMIGGQVVDILGEGKKVTEDELTYMHKKKTGELITAPIVAGALLAKAPNEHVEKLKLYGEKLGVAFQIKDDILDVTGDANVLGKNVHSDDKMHKTTFITTYGLEECKIKCEQLTRECIKILRELNLHSEPLVALTRFLLERNN
ncbi:polyprenyl synthetase family protein [Haloimpatiens lingqiaonensis]|uniref:polyprenyl synthetase family protein n=1 Tax=Haloimpatiens lingqiaonensis TaxID=1380675 RepID=UPI0010FE37A4|nr:farnesyl diphosphate synthase [Haloimpatiens lingqiaonensis]